MSKATRPIFFPSETKPYFRESSITFPRHMGMAIEQKKKNVKSLHENANKLWYKNILEISSRSDLQLWFDLSAFNLSILYNGKLIPIECLYQGSKVSTTWTQFIEFYDYDNPRDIKSSWLLGNLWKLSCFRFNWEERPLEPKSLFYDWLYLQWLKSNPNLSDQLQQFEAFSDIAYNPKIWFACQARTASIYVWLQQSNHLHLLEDSKTFQDTFKSNIHHQGNLF